jgi:Protein of unknown function (DUF2738)
MSKRIPTKISTRNTELLDLSSFDLKRLHFDVPNEMEIQQGNKTIKYYNINIGSQNKSGVGELIVDIPFFAHSFGVEEFQNEQGKATNHSVSLSIVDMANPTEEQTSFVDSFGKLIEKIKDHLLTVKKEIKKPTLDRAELKKFNPMYQSLDDDGNPKNSAWYFAPKLLERKVYNKEDPTDVKINIESKFYLDDQFDENGEPVEISPLEFLGKKHFKFRGAVKIEKIYIGSKISLQCKIYDGVVRQVSNERKRLTVMKPSSKPSSVNAVTASSAASVLLDEDDESDTEIVLEDD